MSEEQKIPQRDIAFDYIRVIAMLMIAFCHFFQIINSLEIAFWLNVGVQIFLVLSAKLLQTVKTYCGFTARESLVLCCPFGFILPRYAPY